MSTYLLAIDFDGTIAQTSEMSLEGMSVPLAYELAIKDVFGQEGEVLYREMDGFRNKAPSELVHTIMESAGERKSGLLQAAEKFYKKNRNRLIGSISEGK